MIPSKTLSVGGRTLELIQGDVLDQDVDALVTAANRLLSGGNQAGFGGGVDGSVHRAAGPELLELLRPFGGCRPGGAVVTGPARLSVKRVIHAVGPIWEAHEGREAQPLASAHRRSLELADQEQCSSVAFPAISCGVYHYPVEQAAPVSLRTILEYLMGDTRITLVRYCLFSKSDFSVFSAALDAITEQP